MNSSVQINGVFLSSDRTRLRTGFRGLVVTSAVSKTTVTVGSRFKLGPRSSEKANICLRKVFVFHREPLLFIVNSPTLFNDHFGIRKNYS